MSGGWIGVARQMLHYLSTVGADRDEEGRFLVRPPGSVSSFMGMEGENAEVVVSGEACYRVGGERWCNLAAGLATTSYGLKVTVI